MIYCLFKNFLIDLSKGSEICNESKEFKLCQNISYATSTTLQQW